MTSPDVFCSTASKPVQSKSSYAVVIGIDSEDSYELQAIEQILFQKHGFVYQQGGVYFGGETVNAVTCILAVMDLAKTFSWFANSVNYVRMLRIEELTDLSPAIQKVTSERH